ncbi:MAG: hypothetical protein CL678_15445 [Bdellovibrionaceae bacterium]|nr:hypothetical protein [Pseudobdellovibrionaceae bacterium]
MRENPEIAALASKLVEGQRPSGRDQNGRRNQQQPNEAALVGISNRTATKSFDAQATFKVLPEMNLVKQILVSSILSPKDLVTTEISYSASDSGLPIDVLSALLDVIEDQFDKRYKIKNDLPEMLGDALFMTGSYPIAILPENVIDKAINSSSRVALENLTDEIDVSSRAMRPIGILGRRGVEKKSVGAGLGLESFDETIVPRGARISHGALNQSAVFNAFDLSVTDNYNVLKMPELTNRMRADKLRDVIGGGNVNMESFKEIPINQSFETALYRSRQYDYSPMYKMTKDSADRDTIGHPLVMKLPSESVIPVHVPGDVSNHLGYYVLLDELGNPLSSVASANYYTQLQSQYDTNGANGVSQLIEQARAGMFGSASGVGQAGINEHVQAYGQIVEDELIKCLNDGLYGKGVEIQRPTEVYRIMLARTMAKKHTQLLYIPVSLLTYVAFDYNEYGIGKSLLEDTEILSGIRSTLMLSNTMLSVKNAVGRTGIKIQLDPKDPNPTETVEFLLNEYAKNRQMAYPVGVNDPRDIINYLQRAGVDVAVSGHPAYPETTFDVEDKSGGRQQPDTQLEEDMKRRHYMGFGLAPETVDMSMSVDFAASVVSSNLLLAKRVTITQDKLTSFIDDLIRKFTLNSGRLMNDLRKVLMDNHESIKDLLDDETTIDTLLMSFINNIETSLPSPDSITLENQIRAYRGYKEFIVEAIDDYISSEYLEASNLGELADSIDSTKASLVALMMRKWMAENNVLPELSEITQMGEKDEPVFNLLDETSKHLEGLARTIESHMRKIKENRTARDNRITRDAELLEEAGAQPEDTNDFGGADDTADTGDDVGGDDMDLDIDQDVEEEPEAVEETPPEEEPADEETPPEEPPEEEEEEDPTPDPEEPEV